MNYPMLQGKQIHCNGCNDGRIGMQNTIRSWWQSRAGLREPPELADIENIARALRQTWHTSPTRKQ